MSERGIYVHIIIKYVLSYNNWNINVFWNYSCYVVLAINDERMI